MTAGTGWNDEELAASVDAYILMLRQELKGSSYSKAAFREHFLAGSLCDRSKASFEKRMGNISYVMDLLGHPTVAGYKPQSHVGSGVSERLAEIIGRCDVPRSG